MRRRIQRATCLGRIDRTRAVILWAAQRNGIHRICVYVLARAAGASSRRQRPTNERNPVPKPFACMLFNISYPFVTSAQALFGSVWHARAQRTVFVMWLLLLVCFVDWAKSVDQRQRMVAGTCRLFLVLKDMPLFSMFPSPSHTLTHIPYNPRPNWQNGLRKKASDDLNLFRLLFRHSSGRCERWCRSPAVPFFFMHCVHISRAGIGYRQSSRHWNQWTHDKQIQIPSFFFVLFFWALSFSTVGQCHLINRIGILQKKKSAMDRGGSYGFSFVYILLFFAAFILPGLWLWWRWATVFAPLKTW